jgi:hypothetical protein
MLITQCADELDLPAYVQYFNKKDNGLYADVQQDSLLFSVAIKSREYMALMNIGPEALQMPLKDIKKEVENTEDFTYIFFKIKNDGQIVKQDSIAVLEQINYFQTGILNDASLLSGTTSITPVISTYVPSNNLTNEHTLILGFPIAFINVDKGPKFKLNKSKYFLKEISISLNKFNGNKAPKLSL